MDGSIGAIGSLGFRPVVSVVGHYLSAPSSANIICEKEPVGSRFAAAGEFVMALMVPPVEVSLSQLASGTVR
jgi:hypothetical protein